MRFRLIPVLGAALVVSVLTLSNVSSTFAQREGADYKIGIVDLQQVMNSYDKQTQKSEEFNKEAEKQREEIKKLKENFKEELTQFSEEQAELSEADRSEREAELDRRAWELEGEERQVEANLARKYRRLKEELLKDIVKAVDEIGSRDNYHLILEADPETRTGVLYFTPTINMTAKVIDLLNKT